MTSDEEKRGVHYVLLMVTKWTSEVLNKFQTNKSNTTAYVSHMMNITNFILINGGKIEGFSEEPALTYVAEREPASFGPNKIKYDVIEARNHKWLLVKSVRSDKNREQGIFVKVTKKEFDEYIKEGVHPGFMLVSYQKYIEHVCHL